MELEERKEKIKKQVFDWIKKPLNASLFGVLAFAFIIRLYYFIQVGAQPLWWDEACYGSLAKNFISHLWDLNPFLLKEIMIRPPLLPFLWSILLRLNIPELGTRFLLEFIPSIISVFFVYLVGKQTFGKRVGIISAFIFSVLWIHLFYTIRLLTNVPALAFLFPSIYFFIKATKTKFNFKYFLFSLLLLSFSTLMRYPNGIIFLPYLIILILNKQFFINKLKFWYSGITGISPMLLFFLYNLITKGNIFPALLGGEYINAGEKITTPFAFSLLNYIPVYLSPKIFSPFFDIFGYLFLLFFILGIVIVLFELLAGYNLISKNQKLKNSLLLVLILIVIYSFFIFYLRGAEDRYLFPTSITLCCFAGFGLNYFYEFVRKYNKHLAIFVLLTILLFGAYSQIKFADNLIENKKISYLQMEQGFGWIKKNTPEQSMILGSGIQPYSIYYAERDFILLPNNYSKLIDNNTGYLIDHVFSPRRDYMDQYLSENQDKWKPINAFFFDENQKQPAFIIYKKI